MLVRTWGVRDATAGSWKAIVYIYIGLDVNRVKHRRRRVQVQSYHRALIDCYQAVYISISRLKLLSNSNDTKLKWRVYSYMRKYFEVYSYLYRVSTRIIPNIDARNPWFSPALLSRHLPNLPSWRSNVHVNLLNGYEYCT